MKLTNLLWTLPFICFLGTYLTLSIIFSAPSITTPSLIGKQLPQAFKMLSDLNLNPRILREQVDNDVQIGTILSQIPAPGQKIKPHQQLFLTISKKADNIIAPQLIGKLYKEITEQLKNTGIHHKAYYFANKKPKGTIIAQMPEAETALEHNTMTLYVSQGSTKSVICPQFINRSVQEVKDFLAVYGLKVEIYHKYPMPEWHVCTKCTVINQQPLAGSMLDLEKGFIIQLKVTDGLSIADFHPYTSI